MGRVPLAFYDPHEDAYAILGVDPRASRADVERAYRRAALTWHPDKSPAPDAAERFLQVQAAAKILRDPARRREYDRLREIHLGAAAYRAQQRAKPPEAHAPISQPPAWLASRVKVHFDAVLLTLEAPRPSETGSRVAYVLAAMAMFAAISGPDLMFGALSLVFLMIGQVLAAPPHGGTLAWAKIVPGRQIAEYHALDQRVSRYDRSTVPFQRLVISIVPLGSHYQVQIDGFPTKAVPVLHRTRDLGTARRCAREAGTWLQIPLAA
jgi:hypothetical protein